jgi:RimJ/RimL family protein N-acetyltransferase
MQEEGAVAALGHVFDQAVHPFPRTTILERWRAELEDPAIAVYVSTDEARSITAFAARRHDELLHFGTALSTWGTGLAQQVHDALLGTFPSHLPRLWLRVFEENHRARHFWEKNGWRPDGVRSRSPFAPHPILLEYERALPRV